MKRRDEVPAVTPQYMAALSKLFARSPAEIEAERQARQPPPRPADSRKGPKSAPESTQAVEALPVPYLPKRRPENG